LVWEGMFELAHAVKGKLIIFYQTEEPTGGGAKKKRSGACRNENEAVGWTRKGRAEGEPGAQRGACFLEGEKRKGRSTCLGGT